MAYEGDTPKGPAIDRSDRHGHIGWVLLLAGILVGATLSLRFLAMEHAQLMILGLLAFFAMAGVFFLFAMAIGVVQFSGQTARNDITKLMADTSSDGLVAIEDDGRITYANEAYLSSPACRAGTCGRSSACSRARPKSRRRSIVLRRPRARAHRLRGNPPAARLDGAQEFGWYRVRVRPVPRPNGRRRRSGWSAR